MDSPPLAPPPPGSVPGSPPPGSVLGPPPEDVRDSPPPGSRALDSPTPEDGVTGTPPPASPAPATPAAPAATNPALIDLLLLSRRVYLFSCLTTSNAPSHVLDASTRASSASEVLL